MGEQQNRAILEGLFGDGKLKLSAQQEYDLRAEDYVMEMPQSGERIVGRDKMRAFQEAYPNPPDARLRRIVGEGDLFVMEAVSDYGNEVAFVTDIVEFSNGKIVRETRYYASPFAAPEWRQQWVEQIS
jgi:SnoaL-like domain